PKHPRGAAGRLRRLAPALRAVGLRIEFGKRDGHNRRRLITIVRSSESKGKSPSARADAPDFDLLQADGRDGADGHLPDRSSRSVEVPAPVPDLDPDAAARDALR